MLAGWKLVLALLAAAALGAQISRPPPTPAPPAPETPVTRAPPPASEAPPAIVDLRTEPAGPLKLRFEAEHASLGPDRPATDLLLEVAAPPDAPPAAESVAVALVVDTSGSMAGHKLEQARDAVLRAAERLNPADRLVVVTFSDKAEVLFDGSPSQFARHGRSRVERLAVSGDTCLACGLGAAYDLLTHEAGRRPAQVYVLSDGQANRGAVGAELGEPPARARGRGLVTTALGVGRDYDRDTMRLIARQGTGDFLFVHNSNRLSALFERELETLHRSALPAVDVTLTPTDATLSDVRGAVVVPCAAGSLCLRLGRVAPDDHRRVLLRAASCPGRPLHVAVRAAVLGASTPRSAWVATHVEATPFGGSAEPANPWVAAEKHTRETAEAFVGAIDTVERGDMEGARARLESLSARLRAAAWERPLDAAQATLLRDADTMLAGLGEMKAGTNALIVTRRHMDGVAYGIEQGRALVLQDTVTGGAGLYQQHELE